MKIKKLLILLAAALSLSACGGHSHSFGEAWKSDDTSHWHECECGEKSGKANHIDENKDGKCDVCAHDVEVPTPPTPAGEEVTAEEWLAAWGTDKTYYIADNYKLVMRLIISEGETSETFIVDGLKAKETATTPAGSEDYFYEKTSTGFDKYSKHNLPDWKKEETNINPATDFLRFLEPFGANYSKFTYDAADGTYKCEILTISGTDMKNMHIKFANKKVVSCGFDSKMPVGPGTFADFTMVTTFTYGGQTVTLPDIPQPSANEVTSSEWLSAFGLSKPYYIADNYKMDVEMIAGGQTMASTLWVDGLKLKAIQTQGVADETIYNEIVDGQKYQYQFDKETSRWTKTETSHSVADDFANYLEPFGASYTSFTYDDVAKAYKCPSLSFGGHLFSDLYIKFANKQILEIALSSVMEDDAHTPFTMTFELTYGGQVVELPEVVTQGNLIVCSNDSNTDHGQVSGGGTFDVGTVTTISAHAGIGFSFVGWFKNNEIEPCSTDLDLLITVEAGTTTYTAHFEVIIYEITYHLDGGTNHPDNPNTYTVETNDIVLLPPTKEGYLFSHWETDTKVRIESIPKGSTGNISIYAVWLTGFRLDISYDNTRGSVTGAGTYAKNEKVWLEATPNEGYSFKGYYSNSACTSGYLISSDARYQITVTDNQTVYAKFNSSDEDIYEWKVEHGLIPYYYATNVRFGLYPQTHVSDSNLISELNKLDDSSIDSTTGYYFYNNEYYVKEVATPKADTYRFKDKTLIVSGESYWFKCEQIKWDIVETQTNVGDKVYSLMSSSILDVSNFGERYKGLQSKTDYNGTTEDVYSNNYKYSNLRTFLNTTFYDKAFGLVDDDSLINTNQIRNDLKSTSNWSKTEYTCGYTQDKVYELSNEEKQTLFGNTISKIQKVATDYARCRGVQILDATGHGTYLTRSPGSNDIECHAIGENSGFECIPSDITYGVLPRIVITRTISE